MESLAGDDSPEHIPGRKKSKLKILKSRLFRKSKKAGDGGMSKLSQSTSDITAGKGLGSEEDLACSEVVLGSRSLSHDSIFMANEVLADPGPTRVLSQENVHGKIKALQVKLQLQKLNLGPATMGPATMGPATMGPSIKLPDHLGQPPAGDSASQQTPHKEILQPSTHPLSPTHKPSATRCVASIPSPSAPAPPAVLSTSPTAAGLASDFSSPAQVTSCLDTSAARHRMSVKPRNQRASSKGRKLTTCASSLSDLPNPMSHPAFEKETSGPAEEDSSVSSHLIQVPPSEPEGANISFTPQGLPVNSLEAEAIKPEAQAAAAASQSETSGATPQLLGAKSHQPIDLKYWRQPTAPCVLTEGDKVDHLADVDTQAASLLKSNFNSTRLMGKHAGSEHSSQEVSVSSILSSLGSAGSFRSSSVNQRGEAQRTAGGTQRQGQGSGSFHVSSVKGQAGERPRSSSFVGPGEHAVTRLKAGSQTLVKSFTSNINPSQRNQQEVEHLGDVQGQRGASVVATAKHEQVKTREALKKGDSAQAAKQATLHPGSVTRLEGSQEGVEESVDAEEDQEEQGTAAFGVKLRSTSLSLRYRTEDSASGVKRHSTEMVTSAPLLLPSNPSSASMMSGEKGVKRNMREEIDQLSPGLHEEGPVAWSLGHAGGTAAQPVASSLPVKPEHRKQAGVSAPLPETLDISLNTKGVETTDDTQDRTASRSAPADVSWMSMAMEKTRTFPQFLTSKMPRDLNQGQNSSVQANKILQSQAQLAAVTQAVVQPHDMPQIQAASQPLAEAMKPPVIKAVSSQTAKPFQALTRVQQNIPLNASKTPPMQNPAAVSKQGPNMPLHPNTAQPIIQSSAHAASSLPATPAALQPSTHMENMALPALGSTSYSSGQQPTIQQPSKAGRGVQYTNQLKAMSSTPTTSTPALSAAHAPASASIGGGVGEEGASQSGRRTGWQASVGERAAFMENLENLTEGSSTHGFKVDQSKSQTNTQAPIDSLSSIAMNKDTTSERKPGGQLPESSPTKVPGRLADYEDKKLRQRTQTSSSPSSSAAPSFPLQSAPDTSQPSWMELAKRKSMAWSDKTMD